MTLMRLNAEKQYPIFTQWLINTPGAEPLHKKGKNKTKQQWFAEDKLKEKRVNSFYGLGSVYFENTTFFFLLMILVTTK